MLSTTRTLHCPTCDQPAVLRVVSCAGERRGARYTMEPIISFLCRRGCVLDEQQVRRLYGFDPAPAAEPAAALLPARLIA